MPDPKLSDSEWATFESFLDMAVRDRDSANVAFWEETFANDHCLSSTYKRPAWLGDRVLNLALADRAEHDAPRVRKWAATEQQTREQSNTAAAWAANAWPPEVLDLLRMGNTWAGRGRESKHLATFAEAVVGVVFREAGYEQARAFVVRHW